MQTQMTERDKRLIVMLSLIVIIVGFGWWGIRPSIKSARESNKEYEQQKAIQQINDMKLSQLPIYQVEAESYDELIEVEKEKYFPLMKSSEVDRYFTDMALAHNLYAYDLGINMGKEPVAVEPYQYSSLAAEVEAAAEQLEMMEDAASASGSSTASASGSSTASTSGSSEKKDAGTDEESSTVSTEETEDPLAYEPSIAFNSEIYGVDINMRLSGKRSDLEGLIDELSKSEKRILVKNFVWSEEVSRVETENADGETVSGLTSTSVLNVNLTLYMCDTRTPEERQAELNESSEGE